MDPRVLFTGVAVLVAIIWYLAGRIKQLRARRSPQSVSEPVRFSDSKTCAQILACKGYDNTGAKNLYSDVKSRAIPNGRLILAFDIDNSFTTSDDKRRKEFNLEAVNAIKITGDKWQEVAVFAKDLVGRAIPASDPATINQQASVTLDSLVRSVCLKIVLHVLFDEDPLELDNESIVTITESINTLWIQSKGKRVPSKADKSTLWKTLAKSFPGMDPSEAEKITLWKALKKVFPGVDPSNKRGNPLNLIIPSYETLWRVVLAGFLQVTFVKGGSPAWRSTLEHFFANPTIEARKEFSKGSEDFPVSVDHLVKETLRLYPSVKRVYRQLNLDGRPGPEDVAADIERPVSGIRKFGEQILSGSSPLDGSQQAMKLKSPTWLLECPDSCVQQEENLDP